MKELPASIEQPRSCGRHRDTYFMPGHEAQKMDRRVMLVRCCDEGCRGPVHHRLLSHPFADETTTGQCGLAQHRTTELVDLCREVINSAVQSASIE